ncbi:uncharacterized protein K489DRAFT_434754 [Dissoconium aciculare CBS 342.82]|uniref:Uncharacterized protein n=1 Tax=Dissoconium aciculare CBS 342.82 TaxID=1314786 RepID=A0A6J3LSZ1_9PEZI|nr:uncharacterized protein K489DRAFT_434754 [Dissoconium aciculare CBS 342.82]KAF1818910.1 hypothetical protein K489DRAFT_434754 [Dissoconium aciculare CBS 342.82]
MVRLTFIAAAVFALGAAASPVVEIARDNCGTNIGDCYGNGCEGVFANPNDQYGTCSAGRYAGCECRKCGGKTNSFRGACNDNGCMGLAGICQAGNYQGCPCN